MIHQQSRQAKLFLSLAVASLMAVSAQTPALADSPQSDGIQIDAHGLDLRTQAGEALLHQRVIAAAHKLCVYHSDPGTENSEAFMACVRDVTRGATPQIRALVAAAHGQTHDVAAATLR